MPSTLTLLHRVCWNGTPVAGERSQTLLAVLTRQHREGASTAELVEEVWGDDTPANPAKALQVVVSRTRSATAPEVVQRTAQGYRLGPVEVDVISLASLVREAGEALAHGELKDAQQTAREAIALDAGEATSTAYRPDPGSGALAQVRGVAHEQVARARLLLALALSRGGAHDEALPLLEDGIGRHGDDDERWVCLLRSEAAVRGPGAALERYERHRTELSGRLGIDPSPRLQRLHGELLAADRPVREGVHFDATPLLGRDDDLRALREMVGSSRVTSIVGAGGLGKTRLAHVLARSATQPVVHFVELAGVAAEDDVVGEVGSALGVRDSVSTLRGLTPRQRADVRSRVAAQLDGAPSLLVLDNCEHVITAAADLVAFLVATTGDLRIVTTSRAPLAIAAERVYALGELGVEDAAELFVQRAEAARSSVTLERAMVTDVVTRLDCLPLAIELAAAKVRVMSLEDLSRRLEHRFALLRGGDRSAPDRHQTLLAVIDWSWNLLAEQERRALRTMSVFHDGFTLAAAEEVLGPEALDSLQHLVDQSLLTVTDSGDSVRYRMLETVREFGSMQLVDAGEDGAARAAQRAWARAYAGRSGLDLHGPHEFAAIDAIRAEEGNLSDVLHRAVHEPDPDTVVALLAALGNYWTILGEHARVFVLVDGTERALAGWVPSEDLTEVTRVALIAVITNALIGYPTDPVGLRALLTRLGPGDPGSMVNAAASVLLALDPDDRAEGRARLEVLCADPDRLVAGQALRYCAHLLENGGDPEGGLRLAERCLGLWRDDDGQWARAVQEASLAQLHSQLGRADRAAEYAERAVPVLDRLGAHDDRFQMRQLVAVARIVQGRLDEAKTLLDEVDRIGHTRSGINGVDLRSDIGRAELALARGDVAEGLLAYRASVQTNRALQLPGRQLTSGLEPWTMFAESAALAAYALHGTGQDGEDLWEHLRASTLRLVRGERDEVDYPVLGLVLYSLGLWGLRRESLPAPEAVRLVVLADRFGYNRFAPTIAWEHAVAAAEQAVPGALAAIQQGYGERRGPELLSEATTLLEQLFG